VKKNKKETDSGTKQSWKLAHPGTKGAKGSVDNNGEGNPDRTVV
jgi:hypothetical protein